MSRPVTPCRSVSTLETLIAADSSSFSALLVPGALVGQVPPVAGVQPDDPELRGGHEAGGAGAAPEARCQPPRIGWVPLGAAGQVPGLLSISQHALEPARGHRQRRLPPGALDAVAAIGTMKREGDGHTPHQQVCQVDPVRSETAGTGTAQARRAGLPRQSPARGAPDTAPQAPPCSTNKENSFY